jgi:hypothetical protein
MNGCLKMTGWRSEGKTNMRPHAVLRGLLVLITGLILAGLACNAPLGTGEEVPSPPAGTVSLTTVPAETTAGAAPTVSATPGESTPLPTFTRIQPTLAPTVTAKASSTVQATPTMATTPTDGPAASPTVTGSPDTPLSFTYTINWRLDAANPMVALASVVISAQGGGGGYLYFRDDLPVAGPAFEYAWAACTANPGSLRVDSANGQSVRVDYFEQAPCPTPTPTRAN